MNDFLDNLANHQYQKMLEKIEVESGDKLKLKDMDSSIEIDIDYVIDVEDK